MDGPQRPPEGTLARFVEDVWWPTVKASTSTRTHQSYKSIYDNHFGEVDRLPIKEIRLPILQAWIDSKSKYIARIGRKGKETEVVKTRSPKTVRTIYGVMTSMLNLASKTGDYPYRDHELVGLPDLDPSEVAVPDVRQCRAVLAAVAGTWAEGPAWGATMLGMRRGEALGAKRSHVELLESRAVVTLQDTLHEHGEEHKLKSKKKGVVRRLVLPREWGEKLLSFSPPTSIYLFTGEDGGPLKPSKITKEIPRACAAAGLPHFTFHSLRHACATNLMDAGVPEAKINEVLGHTTIRMTREYLAHHDDAMLDAFLRLGDKMA